MQGRLVTVFGGSGFIGRYLVKRLAEAGARVRVAVRRPEAANFLKPLGTVGQVVPWQANLRVDSSVAAAVAGADAVVNLVGILYEAGPQRFGSIQARGPEVIAEAAKAAGVGRVVHISAIGADAQSESLYARSKAAGETGLRKHFAGATILRPSVVFGAEDSFLNRFAAMARLLPALPLIAGGQTRFQPVYVGDVANAILAALQDAKTEGQTYELGGPGIYTFEELLRYILRETGRTAALVPLPEPIALFEAWFLEKLPKPLLTRDQVILLRRDNVVAPGMPGLAELGVTPTPLEAIAPAYLARYRRGGGRSGVLAA
jgi:NADH dehydrogenase